MDVALYTVTDREGAEELATRARKGVLVSVYRDREQDKAVELFESKSAEV